MLRQQLTPKNTALIPGVTLLLCALLGFGFRWRQSRNVESQEAKTDWQRDREMGVPDTGLGENATPEEKEAARTRVLEEKMTQERAASPVASQ